jgi:hypothetical protein
VAGKQGDGVKEAQPYEQSKINLYLVYFMAGHVSRSQFYCLLQQLALVLSDLEPLNIEP